MTVEEVPTGAPLVDEGSLQQVITRVVTGLRGSGVPFALTGGAAVYARGGPATTHDIDVLVCRERADDAVAALVDVGMRAFDPPEDWLTKVFYGDWLVDIIWRPNDRECTPEVLTTAEELRFGSVTAPVMPATALLVDKLLVLGPHRCDFTEILPVARALREQIDWREVRREVRDSPYAESFLLLADRLEILDRRTDE
jgi:hypothetical protein